MMKLTMDLTNKKWIIEGEAGYDYIEAMLWYDIDIQQTKFKNFKYTSWIEGPSNSVIDMELVELNPDGPRDSIPVFVAKHRYGPLLPETDYVWHLSFFNLREETAIDFSFTTPRPPKPFDSWTWNSNTKEWAAPVEPPKPVWDEDSQEWIVP